MKDKNTNKNATKEVDLNEKATNTLNGNEELKTSCESCKKSFHPMTLLKHIGQSKDCKVFYGPRFKEMKKRQERERKQRYRNNMTSEEKEKTLKRRRELHSQKPEIKKKQGNKRKEDEKSEDEEEELKELRSFRDPSLKKKLEEKI